MPALPEVILIFAILGFSLWGALGRNKEKPWIFRGTLVVFLGLIVSLFFATSLRDITFNGHFFHDSFSAFIKYVVAVATFVILLNLHSHLSFFKVRQFEFAVLLLCAVLGMFILISSNDFLPMYIALEMQSLCFYVLIGLFHKERHVTEAVVKYFILGGVASGFILFGISFIYGYSGTTNFDVLENALNSLGTMDIGFSVGLAFVICGLAFKASAVPFHMWTPDVYQSTPYALLILIATAPKITVLGFLMRFLCGPIYNGLSTWQPILICIALASMVLGAVAAVPQTNLRRFLAYASISSVGFSLIGIAFANETGLQASLFYTSLYVFAMIGLLTCVMILLRNGATVDTLADLKGLAIQRPFVAVAIAILILTLSGLPPFPGFLGKLFLLQAAVGSEFYTVAIFMVLTTVVTAYYYLNILKIMFFDSGQASSLMGTISANLSLNYLIVITSIGVLTLLIFMPKYLFNWTNLAAVTLFYT